MGPEYPRTNKEKINGNIIKDNDFWSYLGNSIVDPYIRSHPDEVEIIDVVGEGCMPERKYGENTPENFVDYYFKKNYHLNDVNSTMIMLHNSWSPQEFKKMTEDDFLSYDCTISNILSEVLEINCSKDKRYWDAYNGNKIVLNKLDGTQIYDPVIQGLNVLFKGKNSTVELNEPLATYKDSNFILGDNSKIVIQSSDTNTVCVALNIFATAEENECYIGNNFSCNNLQIRLIDEKKLSVEIGDDCVFKSNVEIRPSDGFTIYDKNSGVILNKGENILIGNHTCIEKNVSIEHGSIIPDNTVILSNSIIREKYYDEYTCIAGNPSKVIFEGVNWDNKRADVFDTVGK